MIKNDCVFCKIANGDIPSYSLYEDKDFKVILDIEPSSKGHALIISKNHATNIFELDDATASKALIIAKKVGIAIKSVLNCSGMNILQNNGESAGQTVLHYHIHLIPRYDDDKVTITWEKDSLDENETISFVKNVQERI